MKKNITLIVVFLATALCAANAFAEESQASVEPVLKYSIQLEEGGEPTLPARHVELKPDFPIALYSTLGENPYTGEPERKISFRVTPQVTENEVKLDGSLQVIVDGQLVKSSKIDQVIERKKLAVFSFELDGKLYEILLKTN